MPTELSPVVLKDNLASPAPLGLFGFGMTTVLLNLHNAGFYEMNSMILAMGLFYGGLAQVIAGILEYRKNNTFGMTAFISYGISGDVGHFHVIIIYRYFKNQQSAPASLWFFDNFIFSARDRGCHEN